MSDKATRIAGRIKKFAAEIRDETFDQKDATIIESAINTLYDALIQGDDDEV